jgi:hypothetical protein
MAQDKVTPSTILKSWTGRVSPDDVRNLEIERDARLRADQRTELEKHFGDPPYQRSALADYRRRQGECK